MHWQGVEGGLIVLKLTYYEYLKTLLLSRSCSPPWCISSFQFCPLLHWQCCLSLLPLPHPHLRLWVRYLQQGYVFYMGYVDNTFKISLLLPLVILLPSIWTLRSPSQSSTRQPLQYILLVSKVINLTLSPWRLIIIVFCFLATARTRV